MRKIIFAFILTAALAAAIIPSVSRAAEPLPESYFCMHIHSHENYEQGFSRAPFGILRTWDSGIAWPGIEPEKGVWKWELLDNYVRLSRDKNAKLIMTLAMTPKWAAKNPDAPSPYGGNVSSSPPGNIADWEEFIRAVAERNERVYGGAIRHWEIWNEPDNAAPGYAFYTGTVEEMAALARSARTILKAANPANMIISPGITQVGQLWLDRFLAAGGGESVDIIGFHFYWDWFTPAFTDYEKAVEGVNKAMEKNGAAGKPVWVTETGFAVKNYKTQELRDMALAMTVIAPAYYGAEISCLYSLNGGLFSNLFDSDSKELTATGGAYIELRRWLLGASVEELSAGKGKTRIFRLARNGAAARIIWRYAQGKISFKIDETWGNSIFSLDGRARAVPPDRTVEIGNSPLLISDTGYFADGGGGKRTGGQ